MVVIKKPKNTRQMSATLKQMEKIVDDKLANQKVFIPILLTVITSVIAFLFVHNLGDDLVTIQMYFLVFCYALLCFTILILSLFGQSDYDAKVKKTMKPFQPHRLSSYCYLSDEEYLCKLRKYAGRDLSHEEKLSAQCIKQKINEYAFKKGCLNVALGIVLAGVLLLGIVCLAGVFILPTLPQFSGGTT
jgi:hypothetical protein